ncbi:sulfurtransferase [Rhodococcus rhodochrous]|uniref:sulfurtransferase n=1 Tax=Rhodococcus rhodochrous TaxID=1829 RepID=UPI001E567055|nr:sulfurtransferase [Rhodococcus rhodochrous]MCB8913397.1 sulfurtransferase [Rhodococcus rhodochrous]
MSRENVLIGADELAELLATDPPPVVLDVRWRLDHPDGRDDYLHGHIPTAVYVDLEQDLSDHGRTGRGRHPLPTGDALEESLRRWGVRSGVPVVIYDDWNRAGSARAWWVLRAAGLTDVRVLDGGLAAWIERGGELRSGTETPDPGDVPVPQRDLYAGALPTLTEVEAAALPGEGLLLDARAPERYCGEVEPVDPIAGHIPGAINAPNTATFDEQGRFRSAAELSVQFAQLGVDDADRVGVYCGSGVTAAVSLLALAVTGRDAALFPGSWSQWSSNPDNPVATGDADVLENDLA